MPYLFLSFADKLDNLPNYNRSVYNLSLNKQYEILKKRIPANKVINRFEDFINKSFPPLFVKKYYISCPNFLRERNKKDDNSPAFLNNVVIRPELTPDMKNYLPNNQNLILIGDIKEGDREKIFMVNAIEFIDDSMSSSHDICVNAAVCSSFNRDYNRRLSWSSNNIKYEDSLFTPDFISILIKECFTVDNPYKVREIYENWNNYINFRKYYLEEQSKRNFFIDTASYIEAYAVNRNDYRQNKTLYDDYLLDGHKDFSKGDMILLSTKIKDAEEFPLVKITIDRNKKEYLDNRVNKGNTLVNEEEIKIRALVNDNVFITALDPKVLQNENSKNDNRKLKPFLDEGYILGDRFKTLSFDIFPTEHIDEVTRDFEKKLETKYASIENRYKKLIKQELNECIDHNRVSLENYNELKLEEYIKNLSRKLDSDVLNNADVEISNYTEKIKAKIKADVLKNNKKSKNIDLLLEEEYKKIDVKSLYIERNDKLIMNYKTSLNNFLKQQLSEYKIKKEEELNNKYRNDIIHEKNEVKKDHDVKLNNKIENIVSSETIIRFVIYFRLGDPNNVISNKEKEKISNSKYIVYDNRAEEAKIKRQETALNNFYSGYVKNPYLSTYLFDPDKLSETKYDYTDWHWYLDSLNSKQKEAVKKAFSSNGLFLLQGPPGTGKTQVIAETVAQMVKIGKKVLISSETHKAIDNVFERLPKIAEIVPIRLVTTASKKGNNLYDPKYLVDNFYDNISTNMHKAINRYKNFKENKEEFSNNFATLKLLKSKLDDNIKLLDDANIKIKKLDKKSKEINSEILKCNKDIENINIEIDNLKRTQRHIKSNNFNPDDDIRKDIINNLREELINLFNENIYSNKESLELIKLISNISNDEINNELNNLDTKSNEFIISQRRDEIKNKMSACKDEFDDILPEKQEEYDKLKQELMQIVNQKKEFNNIDSKLTKIFSYDYITNNIHNIKNKIECLKDSINDIKSIYNKKIYTNLEENEIKICEINQVIIELKNKIKDNNRQISEIKDDDEVSELEQDKFKLERKVDQFFKDFEITEPYKSIDDALDIIEDKWNKLESNFVNTEKENKEKIPMYEKIANYLSSEDVIEQDRKYYTKQLFENANVFGITCTSNNKFTSSSIEALNEYNIEQFDIKNVGIDVVIIDEVSKSSFIDLLIPILYGKTVILVGDHRQLPPMYEFSKLKKEAFIALNPDIITYDINKKFTEMYEECFFKTLFERIPDSYKTMLTQQYRCHEHIMNVFNHFYQGKLQLGFDGQNNFKKHNIKLISNGRTIIEPEKHIYFVDCKKNETHENDSTSMYNSGEAEVIVDLIKKLNDYFSKNTNLEKLSIGVICTYSDQARKIRQLLKKVKTGAFKTDVEKMIVSTVDDFQGDERDIILFSTVRNPLHPEKSNPGFILAYERINVALSRARRLLVMVGNRNYLESKGVIDLPDINGNGNDNRNFRVYEKILKTIEIYGKVLDDIDILEDKETSING